MRALAIALCFAASTAEAAPDASLDDQPSDVPGLALEGPFTSRALACEAVLGTRGTCATYHAEAKLPATHDWRAIEIGAVRDLHENNPKTRHFAIVVRIGAQWFASYLGTNGTIDTEYFPPCRKGTSDKCTPFHRDAPASFTVPTLALVDAVKGGAKEIVLFYRTPADVGFRDFAPNGELIQVCGSSADHAPSCTQKLIAVTRAHARMKSLAQLFTGTDEVTPYTDEVLADGAYHPYIGHLKL